MMPQIADALTETGDGVILALEVSSGSRKDLFPAGFNPWRKTITCRVRAPALEGRANASVLSLVATTLDLPSTSVQIISGATSSTKRVLVIGFRKQDLVLKLGPLME